MERKSEQSQKLKNLQLERFLLARESILRQLDDLRILAPIQGTIAPLKSSTDILIGIYLKAATPLAKLINVDQLTVRASYPADDISEIEEGMGRIEITGPLEEGDQISQTNHGFTGELPNHRNITVLQNKEVAR
jgi:multidrug resistance efflux pump